ncbi:telomere-binding protein cav-like [Glossina fuscipes fuscipes]|nr:hypothetical protein GQX74_005527 [Glossina fuscipes]
MNSPSDNEEINEEIVQILKQKWTLSEEDLKRQFTKAELKKLCLKRKCRVDMWKWNPVNEMHEKLVKDGRFKQRPTGYCLRLTAKGVNKYKHKIMYDRKIIKKAREEDRRDQLKNSILSLGMWLAEEKEKQQDEELRPIEEHFVENEEVQDEVGDFGRRDNEVPSSSKRTSEFSTDDIRREIGETLDVDTESMSLNTSDLLDSESISAPTNYVESNDKIRVTST